MSVLVIGCGSFGKNIALALNKSGYDVTIIDKNYQNFMSLPESFRGKRINGDAMTSEVLHRAKIEEVTAVILSSRNDVNNIVQGRILKEVFHVRTLIALNTDPTYRSFYLQMNIPTISLINWGALRIEEWLKESTAAVDKPSEITNIGFYNYQVPADAAPVQGSVLAQIPESLFFAVNHEGLVVNFTDETTIYGGDILHISATNEGLQNLATFYKDAGRNS